MEAFIQSFIVNTQGKTSLLVDFFSDTYTPIFIVYVSRLFCPLLCTSVANWANKLLLLKRREKQQIISISLDLPVNLNEFYIPTICYAYYGNTGCGVFKRGVQN